MACDLPIRTERLTLRALCRADIPALVALVDDYEVSRWLSVVPYPYTQADGAEFLRFLAGQGPLEALGIEAGGRLVGVVGITTGTSSLGYWLGRACHGQGYMSEAAAALVDHYFATAGADVLHSGYFEGNAASARVLEKLGFVSNGSERVKSRAQGTDVTLKKTILVRAKWRGRHAD